MGRLVHFEIHASNPDALAAFYSELFGWSIDKWAGPVEYWLINTGSDDEPGIHGGLMRRHGAGPAPGQPVSGFTCVVAVDDIDASLARAQELGATVALPKQAVPGVGWTGYVMDPDGNVVGMMQSDETAS